MYTPTVLGRLLFTRSSPRFIAPQQKRYTSKYMKVIVILVSLFLSSVSIAENICPEPKDKGWDRLPEAAYHPAAVKKSLNNLDRYFSGELIVAEEFIEQNMSTIRGGFLYKEMQELKDDPKYFQYAKESFCKFMEKNAYLVH